MKICVDGGIYSGEIEHLRFSGEHGFFHTRIFYKPIGKTTSWEGVLKMASRKTVITFSMVAIPIAMYKATGTMYSLQSAS